MQPDDSFSSDVNINYYKIISTGLRFFQKSVYFFLGGGRGRRGSFMSVVIGRLGLLLIFLNISFQKYSGLYVCT